MRSTDLLEARRILGGAGGGGNYEPPLTGTPQLDEQHAPVIATNILLTIHSHYVGWSVHPGHTGRPANDQHGRDVAEHKAIR
jgi:hypothetical protein